MEKGLVLIWTTSNRRNRSWPFYYFHVLSTTICVTFESYCSEARYADRGHPSHRAKRYYFHVLSTTILCYLWILLFKDCFSHSQTFKSIDLAGSSECSVKRRGETGLPSQLQACFWLECTQTDDRFFCYIFPRFVNHYFVFVLYLTLPRNGSLLHTP